MDFLNKCNFSLWFLLLVGFSLPLLSDLKLFTLELERQKDKYFSYDPITCTIIDWPSRIMTINFYFLWLTQILTQYFFLHFFYFLEPSFCTKDPPTMKHALESRTATPTVHWWCTSQRWCPHLIREDSMLSVVFSPERLPLDKSAESWDPTTSLERRKIYMRSLSRLVKKYFKSTYSKDEPFNVNIMIINSLRRPDDMKIEFS